MIKTDMIRSIIHIDMDAFFASIEQRDKPELRGRPVAIGFDGPHGVVSTASYEARLFGVHSAMSMRRAKILCPQLIIISSDYSHYKEVSLQVHEIFSRYTDLIEPLSIDEAFLDVTGNDDTAENIAINIRNSIRKELELTASAGVSYNKLFAKIASDYNKPNGMFVITPNMAFDFIKTLAVEKLWGVGPKTALVMHRMGVFTVGQLRQCSLNHLIEVFGKMGFMYYNFARGIDNREVVPVRVRKSVGCEQTFLTDIYKPSAILIELYNIILELNKRLAESKFVGCTLTLKIKYNDLTQVTRSVTQSSPFDGKNDILKSAKFLLTQVDIVSKPIRLIGLSVSNPPEKIWQGEWVGGDLFSQ